MLACCIASILFGLYLPAVALWRLIFRNTKNSTIATAMATTRTTGIAMAAGKLISDAAVLKANDEDDTVLASPIDTDTEDT